MNQTEKCLPHGNDVDKPMGLLMRTDKSLIEISCGLDEIQKKLDNIYDKIFGFNKCTSSNDGGIPTVKETTLNESINYNIDRIYGKMENIGEVINRLNNSL